MEISTSIHYLYGGSINEPMANFSIGYFSFPGLVFSYLLTDPPLMVSGGGSHDEVNL